MSMMLFNFVKSLKNFLKGLFAIIPKFLYFIVTCILSLIDLCQVAFRKLAGLDPIIISGEQGTYTGDVVYKLITDALFTGRYPAIRTIFWSLIILGVFMLFITSIIALLRLEYNPDKEKGNSKSGVVKNFFKAIFSFAIVPVACLFGMFLLNALVGIVDKATTVAIMPDSEIATYFDKWNAVEDSNQDSFVYGSETLTTREDSYMAYEVFGVHIPTTSQPFSGIVFKACAYGSNRMRNNEAYYKALYNDNALGLIQKFPDNQQAANIIDTGFAINAKLKGTFNLNTNTSDGFFNDCLDFINLGPWSYSGLTSLSKYNVDAVFYFYDLWTFNYIIAFVAVISIGKMYYNFLLYLMQRIFEILGLFLVSPISISLMPLDNGESLKSWRTLFITKFVLLVIMVGSLNLVTPLVSICQNISFFGIGFLDYILLTFFVIAAFNAVDALNKMFAKIFTGDDKNFNQVGEAGDKISGNFKQGLNKTMSAARVAAAPVTIPMKGAGMLVGAGVGALAHRHANNRRDRINSRLNERQREADNTLQSTLQGIENEGQGLQSKFNDVTSDEKTLNQFNNETGGFLERNDDNDKKMLNEYYNKHFPFGRKPEEAKKHKERLETDEAYKQQILKEAYDADDQKRMSNFYKDDNTLSKAENEARRNEMFNMFKAGQSGIDSRRDQLAKEQAKYDTEREDRIKKAYRAHDLESSKIQHKREAPERRKATAGKLTSKAQKGISRMAGDIGNITSTLPFTGVVSDSTREVTGRNRK